MDEIKLEKLFKVLLCLAWIDHDLNELEISLLKSLSKDLNVNFLDSLEVKYDVRKREIFSEVHSFNFDDFSEEQKDLLIFLMHKLAHIDNKFTSNERDFINFIKDKLNYNDSNYELVLNRIQTSLILYGNVIEIK
ncbi:hypothetical protein [Leptospira levettii]|uniref:hypothetical protein n=1 Tax=Leptospira levettii TaxID=2023178 RepID=UPI0010847EEF|nr:hypothetical protein [Leptospira levettii]TGL00794.1 hypothetical protein EHQ34_02575 [Leptospira levettii]